MSNGTSVRQSAVNSSELEWLTGLPSHVVAEIAGMCGWAGMYGQRLNVDVGVALNVLILSIFRSHGIELSGMRRWLPGLRSEALLILGQEPANWAYVGPCAQSTFFMKLSGPQSAVRGEVAKLLGVNQADAKALLRFFSPSDVEFLTRENLDRGHSSRSARFSIYASDIANQIQRALSKPLFTAISEAVEPSSSF